MGEWPAQAGERNSDHGQLKLASATRTTTSSGWRAQLGPWPAQAGERNSDHGQLKLASAAMRLLSIAIEIETG